MTTLTVWRFAAPEAAEPAVAALRRTIGPGVDDAALVSWPPGRRTPATRELGAITGPGRLWGGFWWMLFGLIFLTPLAGPRFGAAAGAFAGTLDDFGVADDFVKRVREHVTPGTSALFMLSTAACAEQVAPSLAGSGVEVLRSDLSPEQQQRLFDALGNP